MLTYDMNERGNESLYEHLYRCIRSDIESGAIAANEHLPSKRTFAKHLGVSLITVENAYAQLIAEGYVRALPRRGYYACELPKVRSRPAGSPCFNSHESASQTHDHAQDQNDASRNDADAQKEGKSATLLANFTDGRVPYDEATVRMWARSLRGTLDDANASGVFSKAQPQGLDALRESIARYLRGFRGMEVDPDCIVIGAGASTLYALIVQLLGRDCRYAIEDPGYFQLARVYWANGTACTPVSHDSEGIDADALGCSGANVAHIMPSHQFPCGAVTSIGRRYQLLAWANESPGRHLIEDDYDSEFRLAGRPIPSLSSIDTEGKVIYLNTFSKSLGPALRVAYMVLPPQLMSRYMRELGFYANTVSALDQAALARLIDSGDYERHVNRYRTHHRNLRDALLAALQAADEGHELSVEESDSGLHFLLAGPVVPSSEAAAAAERRSAERALERGVQLAPLSAYSLEAANYAAFQERAPSGIRPRFVMQYSGVTEDAFPQAARVVVEALQR